MVLDASMTLAWLFVDEANAKSDAVLQDVIAQGAIVPSLWRIEVANTLNISLRRGRSDQAIITRAIAQLEELPIRDDTETGARVWSETMTLAQAESLTVYDATYLELALRLDLPLATGDKALIEAGRRRGLDVLTA